MPGPRTVRRVVSLVPCLTETVAALGRADRLVGVTRYCVAPCDLPDRIIRVGGVHDPDIAAIRALAPDLVLLDDEENRREDADTLRAHTELFVATVRRVADVPPLLATLGRRLAAEEAAATLIDAIRDAVLRPAPSTRQSAVVLLWPDPIVVAGPDTYLADVLRHKGVDVLGFGDERYPRPSLLDLVDRRPDLLVLPDEPYPFGAADADHWAERFAASSARPRTALADGRMLCWYGARTARALEVATGEVSRSLWQRRIARCGCSEPQDF